MSTEQATTTESTIATATATPCRDILDALREVLARAEASDVTSSYTYGRIEDAIESAKADLRDSDEPRVWTLTEEGHDYCHDFEGTMAEALAEAENNVDRSNYDRVTGTLWINVRVHCEDTDESGSAKVTCEPDEPDCVHEDGHDWRSPVSLVGGLSENPGCFGHGGGVVCKEVCVRCAATKESDSWAQDMSTGEQGLDSVEYGEPDGDDVSYWQCDELDDVLREAGFDSSVRGDEGDACKVIVTLADDEDADDVAEKLRSILSAHRDRTGTSFDESIRDDGTIEVSL